MKLAIYLLAALLLCAPVAVAQPGDSSALKAKSRPDVRASRYKSGELLVKFGAGPASLSAHKTNVNLGARTVKTFGFIGWQKVKLPKDLSVAQAIAFYQKQPGVIAASPNYVYRASTVPNDASYGSLYGMTKISAPTAWDTTTGSASTVVAVIDTGVAYNHEDLTANMWRNPGESGSGKEKNGVDDDANGYTDDVYGIDAVNGDSNPFDDNHHGTHCAGTIGGIGNNAKGVAGVNWNVKIMALKFLDSGGDGTLEDVITCFQYVVAMKQRGVNIRVTNNSWGGADNSQALKDAMDAAGNAGILNAVAASNEGSDNDAVPNYPANYTSPSIITVAASNSSDDKAGFSNYGATSVDLAAPGVGILSTVPGTGTYSTLSGTSMSTPHVAGAAALLAGYYNAMSVADLKKVLLAGVDRLSQWQGKVVSGGRLNLARSLALSGPTALPVVAEVSPTGTGQPMRPALRVSFTRAMQKAGAQSAFRITPSVAGSFAWSDGNKTMTFTPSANFAADTLVTAKILGSAADTTNRTLDGNVNGTSQGTPADDYTWSFRTAPPPPANDAFANAQAISGAYGSAAGNTTTATAENGEPEHAGNPASHSIWYRWTAPSNGRFIFTTAGSDFDTLLAVYTGTALGSLSQVVSNDDGASVQSALGFTATAGTIYHIAIDGFQSASGASILTWYGNDHFATARALSGAEGTVSGFNYAATPQNGEPAHAGTLGASLWFRWTAPASGQLTLTTSGSVLDTVIAAYSGAALTGLTSLAENDDVGGGIASRIEFPVTAGVTYRIAVDGKNGETQAFRLAWILQSNAAPSVESVTPSSGASNPGTARLFTTTASDADGAADINAVLFHIGDDLNAKNALQCYYAATTNKLYVRDDAGTTWLGGFAPGSSNSISNSQGSLNCAQTSAEKFENQVIVRWSITPNSSLAGSTQNLYLYAKDSKGQSDGYTMLGAWQINGNLAPLNVSVAPASGSTKQGLARSITTNFSDPNGARNLDIVYFHIGPSTSTGSALRCYYNVRSNLLYLRNDTDSGWIGGFAPGSNHIITTSKASLNCAATTVTISGNALAVTWQLTPTVNFVGTQNLYLFVRDVGALSDGWDDLGDWTITP